MSNRCKVCNREHLGFLDVCGPCIAENERLQQGSVRPVKKVVTPSKQTKTETKKSAKQNNNETKKRGRPRKDRTICRKCNEPLADGSGSYCRKHENERLVAWRLKKKEAES